MHCDKGDRTDGDHGGEQKQNGQGEAASGTRPIGQECWVSHDDLVLSAGNVVIPFLRTTIPIDGVQHIGAGCGFSESRLRPRS